MKTYLKNFVYFALVVIIILAVVFYVNRGAGKARPAAHKALSSDYF